MRNFAVVVDQIAALLPNPAPPEVASELTVLTAELQILKRVGAYTPPEASEDAALWQRLSTALYRYLPNPKGYAWAQQISDIVTSTV